MVKIAEAIGREMVWSQPRAMKQAYELEAAGETAGRLTFRSLFGTLATGETVEGSWTFKRTGFWQQRATVRAAKSEEDLAVFTNRTWQGGGTLVFANRRRFRATTNFWNTNFELKAEDEQTLIRFHYGGVFRLHAQVEIAPEARTVAELPILMLFSWYVVVMLQMDAAAAAG